MRIEVSNKIKIYDYNTPVWEWVRNNLVVDNPTYQTLMRIGKEDTIRRTHCPEHLNCYVQKGNNLEIPFGCLYGIWDLIKSCPMQLIFNENGNNSFLGVKPAAELYDYQKEAVESILKAKGGVLVSPCGSGKTFMGIEVLRRLGKKFLWLTHTKDLLNQTLKEIKGLYSFLDIGTITDGKINMGKDGTISTVQTLSKIDLEIYKKEFDIVVVDECAHCAGSPTISKMFQKVVENIPARYKFGLTATPARADSLINTMYMILGMSMQGEFEPTYKIDKERVKTIVAQHEKIELYTDIPYDSDVYDVDGTIIYNELINFLSEDIERNNIVINNIAFRNREGRKQIVLCHRVNQCKLLYNKLKELELNVEVITGDTPTKKRKELLKEENSWDILVATYSLLKEGISIKALDTLHFVTPAKDKSTVVQCVGRIERFLENKKQPIVYDYVDVNIDYCNKAYIKRKRDIKKRF